VLICTAAQEAGVYQEAGVARTLEVALVKDTLKHKLEDPARPSAGELTGQGIRLSEQQQMEHRLAAVQARRTLHALLACAAAHTCSYKDDLHTLAFGALFHVRTAVHGRGGCWQLTGACCMLYSAVSACAGVSHR
jgi:hypothetical protein